MKNISLLLIVIGLSTLSLSAQAPWKMQKRQITAFSFSLSPFSEKLADLSKDDILGLIKDPADRIDMTGFTRAAYYSTEMTGINLNMNLGFGRQMRTNLLEEIQVGVSVQTGGELLLSYDYIDDNIDNPNDIPQYTNLGLCYMSNRIGLSGGYKLRGYSKRSSFTFGPSFTAAKTLNDVVLFLGGSNPDGETMVDAKSSTITNFHFEIDYTQKIVENLAFRAGGRYGYTYFISQNNENSFGTNWSLSLGLEYQFFRSRL